MYSTPSKSMITHWSSLLIRHWENYWFAKVPATSFAISRIAFGLILLLYHTPRLPFIRELYTKDGYLVPLDLFRTFQLPIPDFGTAMFLNITLQAAIISFIVGYRTRAATFTVLILHTYFSLLEYFSTGGFGAIMVIYLILFLFAQAGVFLSIDFARSHWQKGTLRPILKTVSPLVPVTMQRIMLWQLAAIYFFNVLSKLKYGSWLDGRELWYIMNSGEGIFPFISTLADKIEYALPHIGIVVIIGFFLLGVGILIPVLRPYALTFGIIYHVIAFIIVERTMMFSLTMIALYTVAVEPSTWHRWWEWASPRLKACRWKKKKNKANF